ncbi:hypothetical protein RhiJN_17427 [Ceratobasidium sp. AG-Ba]|nr:hypothetical protein RhiJN_17427 [Ceratobasidium sp. AG-Ba]
MGRLNSFKIFSNPNTSLVNRTPTGRLEEQPGPLTNVHDGNLTTLSPPIPLLPSELVDYIASFLFEAHPPTDESASICCVKPRWSDVKGFASASHDLRRMGLSRWVSILIIRTPGDWEVAKKYSQWIRELDCGDGVLVDPRQPTALRTILTHFQHLYAVSIDAHSDVFRDGQNQFAYRDLFRALPPSLRRLEITRAHGPDVRVISTVKSCCPGLEELRLGRCTMFNCFPACDFWESFPFDHDSYMSDQDSGAYARSLSKELSPLQFLRSLRLGLYLIPSTTVLSHRLFHRRNLPAPPSIDWHQVIPQITPPQGGAARGQTEQLVSLLHQQDPESEFGPRAICDMCIEAVDRVGRKAEEGASAIIQELVPSLEKSDDSRAVQPNHDTYPNFRLALFNVGKRHSPTYPTHRSVGLVRHSYGNPQQEFILPMDWRDQKTPTSPLYTGPLLPVELINRIADFAFETRLPADEWSSICCLKPSWVDVEGFMSVSHELHLMGLSRWFAILTIKTPEDWDRAKRYSRWVRELCCTDGAFVTPWDQTILTHFTHLCAVSIDAHGDVCRDSQNQFTYRDLFRAVPPSLRRLEITRAHGPDVRVIATIKECCPGLEELRLGRCTMFNCSPACDFWESFPFDHDSYMSDQDSDAYARSLSKELQPLEFLKKLRLGLYLIPPTTVLSHRLFRRRNLPVPAVIDWHQAIPQAQTPQEGDPRPQAEQLVSFLHQKDLESEFSPHAICAMCVEAVGQTGKRAEASASMIIQELVPSVEVVEWMNWLSSEHLGITSYMRSLHH